MQQLVFVEPGTVAWQDAPDPQPGPGQAVVRPLAVSRCDLDIAMAAFGIFPGPFPVGHEIAAEVVAVGSGVRRDAPDSRADGDHLGGDLMSYRERSREEPEGRHRDIQITA